MACVKNKEAGSFCLIQNFTYNEAFNEFDCPLLTARKDISVVATALINCDVSVLHQCDDNCIFTECIESVPVEREEVQSTNMILEHDYSNPSYFLNIFALSYKVY